MKVLVTIQRDYVVELPDDTPWPTAVLAVEAHWATHYRKSAVPHDRPELVWMVRPLDPAALGTQPATMTAAGRADAARTLGSTRSASKAAAARANGRLGGRPRRQEVS